VRERVKDMDIVARGDEPSKLTEAKWGRFTRALTEFEGWSSRLRQDFGHPVADFVIGRRLVETDVADVADVAKALGALEPNGYEVSILESSADSFRARAVELETSAATVVDVPAALLQSPVYANVRKTYARLAEIVGPPPFDLKLGAKSRHADTFGDLRSQALDLAKEGVQLSRFKGLGEMDPQELWDTTMDPARRMLVRVEVEDAAEADRIFSTLMGDQVEPRREFIEQNAKDVRFLDV
jgi:DNA gyrase subunit B